MSLSEHLNKPLRRLVSPALRAAGFQRVDARSAWAWRNDCIWVFTIRAVGSYFSDVTGWPPSSVGVWLGVRYSFISTPQPVKVDKAGRLLPAEYLCHLRSHLNRRLNQGDRVSTLKNAVERGRSDLWWVDRDGANAEEVALDIAFALSEQGLPWFASSSDPRLALQAVEAERACFSKFVMARYLSARIGDSALEAKYRELAEAEARRINIPLPPSGWFSVSAR